MHADEHVTAVVAFDLKLSPEYGVTRSWCNLWRDPSRRLVCFLCAWMLRFNFQVEPRSLCARRRVCVTLASCWRGIGHTGN